MKKKSIISVFIAAFFVITLGALGDNDPIKKTTIPADVKATIDKSCFGCHNTASKNEDAKEALDFKKLDKLSIIKKISAYKEIGETIEKEEMPPKRFLQKYPEKKLSDNEKEGMMEWSKKEAETLVKSK